MTHAIATEETIPVPTPSSVINVCKDSAFGAGLTYISFRKRWAGTKERGKRRSKGEKRGENKTLTLEPLIINAPVCLLSRHARCASRISVNSFRGRIAGKTEKEGERRGTY